MYPFWPSIIRPLLEVYRPKVMVEIGSEAGRNLANLVRFAMSNEARVHAIDPSPLFDVEQWTARSGGRLVVHRGTSLDVLPTLEAFDMLFIDGDHNWYTVYHELKAVGDLSRRHDASFPLILLHDIGPPWGRRDLYYDPGTIPAKFRQPHSRPRESGNTQYHADFCQALHEGGPRNGVLTAVEDFVAESRIPLDLIQVPGFAGLGILVSQSMRESRPDLAAFLRELELTPRMREYVEDLEAMRMRRRKPGRGRRG